MCKICSVVLKNCPISWLEKFMRKNYKYHKSCAAKLSSNSCVEKKLYIYSRPSIQTKHQEYELQVTF